MATIAQSAAGAQKIANDAESSALAAADVAAANNMEDNAAILSQLVARFKT